MAALLIMRCNQGLEMLFNLYVFTKGTHDVFPEPRWRL